MQLKPTYRNPLDRCITHTQYVLEAAQLIKKGFHSSSSELTACMNEVRELEPKADVLVRDVTREIEGSSEFRMFSWADMYGLFSRINDVLHAIEDLASHVLGFQIMTLPPRALQLADSVEQCSKALLEVIQNVGQRRQATEQMIQVHNLQSDARHMHCKALTELFRLEDDVIKLIKLKNIFDSLYKIVTAFEKTAHAAEDTLLKHKLDFTIRYPDEN